jgi:hypothetical protein
LLDMIDKKTVEELLKTKADGSLHHRESQDLEFKEQFSLNGLAEYFKNFSAFANNKGGFLIFGVKDTPRTPIGLTENSLEQFNKIDPEKISGYLLDIFAPSIDWEHDVFEVNGKSFGVFLVQQARLKPVIAKKNEGRDNVIKSGDIFYRYGGRTQNIAYAELQFLIQKRIDAENENWKGLFAKIAKIGPSNAAILDTEAGVIQKNESQILVIDQDLAKKIKFIKEGQFSTKKGSTTLRLVGDVQSMNAVEVVKYRNRTLLDTYPLSFSKLKKQVKEAISGIKENKINSIIRENGIKKNFEYSSPVFRSKEQEEEYKKTGKLPKGMTFIYNQAALDFIIRVAKNQ